MRDQTIQGRQRSPLVKWAIVVVVLAALVGVVVSSINTRSVTVVIPTHSVPKDNGWDYFTKAGDMIGKTMHFGPLSTAKKSPGMWTMADYEAFMKANATALAVFRQGLTKQCACPPVRGRKGTDASISHLATLRELARTIRGEAMYYEKKGEYGRAVESQLDCVELGVSLPNKAPMVTSLVGIAVIAIGSHGIETNLPKLSPTELAQAAVHMERIQKKKAPFSEVMLEESYLNASNALELRLLGKGDVKRSLEYAKARAAEARKPYLGPSSLVPPNNLFAQEYAKLMDRAVITSLISEASLELLQTEIALRRYNADNGHYPAKLEQLVPKYLKKAPVDPFGRGWLLKYAAVNAGKDFVLYSRGQNMADDGGRPTPRPGDYMTGDIVLGKP